LKKKEKEIRPLPDLPVSLAAGLPPRSGSLPRRVLFRSVFLGTQQKGGGFSIRRPAIAHLVASRLGVRVLGVSCHRRAEIAAAMICFPLLLLIYPCRQAFAFSRTSNPML